MCIRDRIVTEIDNELLGEMAGHLSHGGRVITANWQFLRSDRQRRKIRPWSEVNINPAQVEVGDYLLSWERGGTGRRYVAYLDEAATGELAAAAGLTILDHFLKMCIRDRPWPARPCKGAAGAFHSGGSVC